MLYLVEARGTTTTGARAPVSAAPRHRRRVALLPPKDVALFLPKEQGKETEAVNMCMMKVNGDKVNGDKQLTQAPACPLKDGDEEENAHREGDEERNEHDVDGEKDKEEDEDSEEGEPKEN